jgi:hypothetical protein
MRRQTLKVVLCIREPLDVLASALEVQRVNEFGHTREFYVDHVWRSFEGALQLIESGGGESKSLKVVRYESYVRNPELELASISQFLGINSNSNLKLSYKRDFDANDPYNTELLGSRPTSIHVSSYIQRLSSSEQIDFAAMFSGVRSKLGYHSTIS